MRVASIELIRLDVPLAYAYVGAGGARNAIGKLVLRVETDAGITGLGETIATPSVSAFAASMTQAALGRDPRQLNRMRREMAPALLNFSQGRDGWIAYAALDMACLDILGKSLGVPLCNLFGGRLRDVVAVAGCIGAVPGERDTDSQAARSFMADLANAARYAEHVAGFVARCGFTTLKLKCMGLDPAWDVAAVRDTVGDYVRLRADWNGALSFPDALALGRDLAPLRLEYLEDPVSGLDALARLRRGLCQPLATNMAVDEIADIAPAFRLGAIDVLLADTYCWGGIQAVRDLSGVAEALGLDLVLHSWFELGIATAANLHLAAAEAFAPRAMDTTLHLFEGDIVAGAPFQIANGMLAVPTGAGLGVDLDMERLEAWAVDRRTITD